MVMYRGEERLRPRLGASPEAEDLDLVAITISATSDGLVIRPRGALCAAAAQAFDAVVAAAIASGATRVVVQLDGLTFIDAAALSVFARAHAKAWRRGVDLVVVGADPAILRRFDVAGLRKPLQVQPAGAARSGTGPEAA